MLLGGRRGSPQNGSSERLATCSATCFTPYRQRSMQRNKTVVSAKCTPFFLALATLLTAFCTQTQAGDVRFAVRTGMPQHISLVKQICDILGKELTKNNGTCDLVVQDDPVAILAEGKANFSLISSPYQYYVSTKGMKDFRSVISLELWPIVFLGDPKEYTSADDLLRNGETIYYSRGFPIGQNNLSTQSCPDCSPNCSKNCKCVACLSPDRLNLSRVNDLSGLGLILPFDNALMNKLFSDTNLEALSFSRHSNFNRDDPSDPSSTSYLFPASVAIPAGNQQKVVSTFAMSLTMITNKRLSTDLGYRIAKGIASNVDRLRKLNPNVSYLTTHQTFLSGLTMPMHKGARKFFEE